MKEKLWGGRFSERTDTTVERFSASIDTDSRLYPYDIEGSAAHCKTLAKAGIITANEAATLIEGLELVRRELERGDLQFQDSLEDIHMHVEARLLQLVGPVAQKLHTARSRNDQVVLDVRLFLRHEAAKVVRGVTELKRVIVAMAAKHIDVVMPGYTHLQHAQPVLFSHHLMAYYEMFKRDGERFADALVRINVMPLGCAALAGTPYPIDRHYTAEILSFPAVSPNSIDAVSDRDFIMEFLSAASICMIHLSRLSEELILWSTLEFGFIEISDAFATGSSIMPQKKNPDVPELVRGRTGSVLGDLFSVLTLMKALPLAYNRDMQEDKLPLFRTVDTLQGCLDIYAKMLPNIRIRHDAMRRGASTGFLNATDLADYLVERGMPFREAHGCAGRAVGYAAKTGKELHELTLTELRSFSSLIEKDIFVHLSVEQMIDRRKSFGGTATENVLAAIAAAEKDLGQKKGETC
jgi:argininosuccinate lyase